MRTGPSRSKRSSSAAARSAAYLAPEQCLGAPADPRTDVYALGCLLYEILTLHPAFKSEGMATLNLVRSGDYVPVTERNPRRPVPEFLAELCKKAMALDPGDRPQTAEAFEEHALRGQTFSRSEMEVLRSMLDGGDNSLKGKALQRFEAKLQLPREE